MRIALSLLILAPVPAFADTLWVSAGGVTPFTDIQDAIDASEDGDEILVFPGTYGPIVVDDRDLVIRSTGGPTLTFIDGTGVSAPAALFTNDVPSTTLLHGFTITGGSGAPDDTLLVDVGGGVFVTRDSSPRISGNVITGNTADHGAGVAATGGEPHIYGNVITGNTASSGAGGVLLADPSGTGFVSTFTCNDVRGNVGTTVGGLFVSGPATIRNNVLHGNEGDRGGAWLVASASGEFSNNTITTNVAAVGNAGGVEINSTAVTSVGNLVAHHPVGYGVIHSSTTPDWTFGDLWDNAAGNWSGGAPDPTGSNGNLAIEPEFVFFTLTDPTDDELGLVSGHPLLNSGSSDPAYLDLDGSNGAVGLDGGQKEGCDLDGDGVRAGDSPSDCRPDEADFFPGAYELEGGTDNDCDGYGTLALLEFVSDDGGLLPAGSLWDFAPPTLLPGRGWQGISAWCTDCSGPVGAAASDELEWDLDLSAVSSGTAEVVLIHAWETGAAGGGVFEEDQSGVWTALIPAGGYPSGAVAGLPGAPGAWSGDSAGYVTDVVDVSASLGGTSTFRFRYGDLDPTAAGWTVARVTVRIGDADGDGRAVDLADCDDADPTIYVGAPEVPYDGVDQDCDGGDLVDVDGDGFDAAQVGGPDCDDSDPTALPGGIEIPYDGIDQDCSLGDLQDVDGDGWLSWEVGGLDCDDDDAEISPAADDIPYDGIDQDCDGDDLVDVDGDGFRGDQPAPFGDCDDTDASVNPDADEVCADGVDNDCNDLVDAEIDFDEDGYDRCAGDCDEGSALVNPGADEICDGVDTDCDGTTLDGEVDADGDGDFVCSGDCDDAEAAVGSSRPEVCDGIDNDCDGAIDENLDEDGDGFSGCTTDCDDQRSTVYPGAALDCADNIDHDCDGVRDFEQEECTNPAACSAAGGRGTWFGVLLGLLLVALRRRGRLGFSGP